MVKEVVEKKSKKKVGIIIGIIIGVIVLCVLSFFAYFGFFFFLFAISDSEIEFIEKDNIVTIPEKKITIENTKSYYDKNDECYVLELVINKEDTKENKKKNNWFSFEDTDLNLYYGFYDKEDFYIGNEYLSLENIDIENKWKTKLYYCAENAKLIESYKVKKVDIY